MAQAQAADRRSNKNEKKDELVEKLVHINREKNRAGCG